jgi:HK97 family phage prohead protease
MEPDFSGYATKAGLKCSDGRTILPGAFKHQDKARVPLVWQHGHSDPENVLGHTILENRDDGVYAYGYFNGTSKAEHAKGLLSHGDISMLSIWANELIERSGRVLHGSIREVSLVLSGANPGALIENVTIRHSDGDETLEDEVIIYTGLELEHADGEEESNTKGETIQDVYDTMNDKQKQVLHYMLGQALQEADTEDLQQDNVDDKNNTKSDDKEGTGMTRNVFESGTQKETEAPVLSHADMKGIVADATKTGSLKAAVENYAISHGINQIDTLFPEATALTTEPEFYTRRTEWVNSVLNGARKTPFSRVKTHWADLTYDDARAKGYITGAEKTEEYYGMARRETSPQTIYKKQQLDRDDILDVTDFDVVAWMKSEMRLMLDEELARAILLGDGRTLGTDPDKILEDRIRPIATDDPLFVINVLADLAAGDISDFVDAVIQYRALYRGTGTPTMYTSEALIAQIMLLKDTMGSAHLHLGRAVRGGASSFLGRPCGSLRPRGWKPVGHHRQHERLRHRRGQGWSGQSVRRLRHRLQPVQVSDRDSSLWRAGQAEVCDCRQAGNLSCLRLLVLLTSSFLSPRTTVRAVLRFTGLFPMTMVFL